MSEKKGRASWCEGKRQRKSLGEAPITAGRGVSKVITSGPRAVGRVAVKSGTLPD